MLIAVLGRFAHVLSLVHLRQRFVRRSHGGSGGHKTTAGSGRCQVLGCPRDP